MVVSKVHYYLHAVCGGEPDEEEHPPNRLERAVHHGLRGTQGCSWIFPGQLPLYKNGDSARIGFESEKVVKKYF